MLEWLVPVVAAVLAHTPLNSNLTVTYVTGLWDTKRGDMTLTMHSRGFNYYLTHFAEVLAANNTFIVFGDSQLEQFVWKHRSPDNTQFIRVDLEDIQHYWYTPMIHSIIDRVN